MAKQHIPEQSQSQTKPNNEATFPYINGLQQVAQRSCRLAVVPHTAERVQHQDPVRRDAVEVSFMAPSLLKRASLETTHISINRKVEDNLETPLMVGCCGGGPPISILVSKITKRKKKEKKKRGKRHPLDGRTCGRSRLHPPNRPSPNERRPFQSRPACSPGRGQAQRCTSGVPRPTSSPTAASMPSRTKSLLPTHRRQQVSETGLNT